MGSGTLSSAPYHHPKSSISIWVYSLNYAGLGVMDDGAKPTWTYSWRPAISIVYT